MNKARKLRDAESESMDLVRNSQTARDNLVRNLLLPSLLSSIALWAAFPPLSFGWLAYCAPLGWISIICRPVGPNRLGYVILWLSGCVFWLLALQGIRLAFWPLTFGWIALSMYLAVYIPLFVGIARILMFGWRVPLVFAAPMAWVGMELVRGYFVTGFSACLLAHTQVRLPMVLQIADQLGGYGISFVLMMVSAGLYILCQLLLCKDGGWGRLAPRSQIALAFFAAIATVVYGGWRLQQTDFLAGQSSPLLRVALVQENAPSIFDNPSADRDIQSWNNYLEATRQAGRDHKELDLVIWPESTFSLDRIAWLESDLGEQLPPRPHESGYSIEEVHEIERQSRQRFAFKVAQVLSASHDAELMRPDEITRLTNPHLLVGCTTYIVSPNQDRHLNSALLIGPHAQLVGRYDKVHLVMFGEYIPLSPWLDFLGNLFGLLITEAGREPAAFEISGVRLAPSICFESVLPHFLSWQIHTLRDRSESPDILVNVTNDSWFRGSSILDHHLACGVLASIEHRRPLLIAANCGLSAWIDGAGRIQALSPRLSRDVILAAPYRDNRWGMFQTVEDWPARGVGLLCMIALLSTFRRRT